LAHSAITLILSGLSLTPLTPSVDGSLAYYYLAVYGKLRKMPVVNQLKFNAY